MNSEVKTFEELEKTYSCIICRQFMDNPTTLSHCLHSFCHDCIEGHVKSLQKDSKQLSCPLCRSEFPDKTYFQNYKIQVEMKETQGKCECGEVVAVSKINEHQQKCDQFNKEVEETVKKLKVEKNEKNSINRSTFTCPLCAQKNFDRKGLIEHIEGSHDKHHKPAVCPICVSQPWGDPNYKSKDILGHLKLRHAFDYDTYTDYDFDDDQILQQVIAQSVKNF